MRSFEICLARQFPVGFESVCSEALSKRTSRMRCRKIRVSFVELLNESLAFRCRQIIELSVVDLPKDPAAAKIFSKIHYITICRH